MVVFLENDHIVDLKKTFPKRNATQGKLLEELIGYFGACNPNEKRHRDQPRIYADITVRGDSEATETTLYKKTSFSRQWTEEIERNGIRLRWLPIRKSRKGLKSKVRHGCSLNETSKSEAQFPFKRNRLRCVRCVNENRKKRKRLRWQAANHGCHCFDRAFLLAGACATQALAFLAVFVYATQAIAFEWKPGVRPR